MPYRQALTLVLQMSRHNIINSVGSILILTPLNAVRSHLPAEGYPVSIKKQCHLIEFYEVICYEEIEKTFAFGVFEK